jgi:hypothetical protein
MIVYPDGDTLSIFSDYDLRAIRMELHSMNASFVETKGIIKELVDKQEVVSISHRIKTFMD